MNKLLDQLQLQTIEIKIKSAPGQSYEEAEYFAKGVAFYLYNATVILVHNDEEHIIFPEENER